MGVRYNQMIDRGSLSSGAGCAIWGAALMQLVPFVISGSNSDWRCFRVASFWLACVLMVAGGPVHAGSPEGPALRVASARFEIFPNVSPLAPVNGPRGDAPPEPVVHGPLKTTLTLLEEGPVRICLVTCDTNIAHNVGRLLRRELGRELGIPAAQVLIFMSHNHSDFALARNASRAYGLPPILDPEAELLPVGERYLERLLQTARELATRLEAVTVWWSVGHEDRITYNRKGRRADGSTFFMREEDRLLQGADYRGDVETDAPVVVFKNVSGDSVAALVQFTGHPVTSFNPESPVVYGEWPQVASDHLATRLALGGAPVPVGFLQGCAGDVNSKEMFRGGVERAATFGRMLGEAYVHAVPDLVRSTRDGLAFAHAVVELPLAALPPEKELVRELAEIDAFVARALSGDGDTLSCLGLNFPRDLSPRFRAGLVNQIRPWTEWALEQHRSGAVADLPRTMSLELWVLRVGDVGIVGMPCEPFQGIGRQIRASSPLPLTIPCGYANYSVGYITDGPNTGDREYMSSFYRYSATTRSYSSPRPPLAKPGGDVIAHEAVKLLEKMAKESQ